MKELLDLIHECFRVLDMTGGLLNLFPLVRYVAPDLSGYRPLVRAHQPLWDFLRVILSAKNILYFLYFFP